MELDKLVRHMNLCGPYHGLRSLIQSRSQVHTLIELKIHSIKPLKIHSYPISQEIDRLYPYSYSISLAMKVHFYVIFATHVILITHSSFAKIPKRLVEYRILLLRKVIPSIIASFGQVADVPLGERFQVLLRKAKVEVETKYQMCPTEGATLHLHCIFLLVFLQPYAKKAQGVPLRSHIVVI